MKEKNDKLRIIGENCPNMPWEEKPADCHEVVWRSERNPIIPRNMIPCAHGIYNSAVVPYEGHFAGVFRVDDKARRMRLHAGTSCDGVRWQIDNDPIQFIGDESKLGAFEYGYDPRVVFIEDRYYITWCNGVNDAPAIGLAYTFDFKEFFRMENPLMPCNRNGVLFPRKVNGEYLLLSRPSDMGINTFGDIFCSASPDLCFWGKHRLVMTPKPGWQCTKIGAGSVPIETTEGWIMIYHGVRTYASCMVYSSGAALLDIDEPWKVIARTRPHILAPEELYEQVGDSPNCVFPVATVQDAETGRICIYYGASDTVTCMAFTYVDELVEFIKSNNYE